MSLKVKLTSLITTFILLCSLLAVGVFAVKNTTFNVGGNIEFNVKGIEAYINLTDPGTANLAVNNESPVMQPIEIRNTTTESEIVSAFSTWSNLDLAFSPNKSTATIELEISNKSTDTNNYIGISASADALTKNNAEIIVTNNAGGQTALIGKDQTATFTITFKVVDDGYSAKLDNFIVKFDMKKLDNAELPIEGEVNSSITPSDENELTITKEDSTTKATQTLTETVSSTSQIATYTYDIKNNSYTESIYLNPTATLSEEQTDVATSVYYSVEDNEISTFRAQSTEYKLLTEDYLVILPQKSVKVQIQMLPINVTSSKEVSTVVELNLHAEKPADFVQDYTYEIIDNEVYRTPICNTCECYQATEKMNADEYIIATPETAQSILDSDINGKTIVFAEGEYDEALILRASAETSIINKAAGIDGSTIGEKIDISNIINDAVYHYTREIIDVVFAGTKEAFFTKSFMIISGNSDHYEEYVYQYNYGTMENAYDPIRGSATSRNYYVHLKIDGINFNGMHFKGEKAGLIVYTRLENAYIKNITIQNNSFIGDKEDTSNLAAISLNHYLLSNHAYENIVVKNNIIDDHYQGFVCLNAKNVKVYNNKISNTEHNAIGIQANGHYFTGKINIVNNEINNVTDRAIRFNTGKNADILVEGNSFVSSVDGNSLLKTQVSTNTTYKFLNNYYEGNILDNKKGSLNSTQWEVTV